MDLVRASERLIALCLSSPGQVSLTSLSLSLSLSHLFASVLLISDFTSKADKGTPILLVGTKLDLAQERAVPPSLISDVCERYGCSLVETSAKTGAGVEEAFAEIARAMLATHQDRSEAQRRRALTDSQGSGQLDFDELIPRKRKKVFCCIPI